MILERIPDLFIVLIRQHKFQNLVSREVDIKPLVWNSSYTTTVRNVGFALNH